MTCTQLEIHLPGVDTLVSAVGLNPHSFFLDSSDKNHPRSRFSYAGIHPRHVYWGDDNPWPLLEKLTRDIKQKEERQDFFTGGWVIYLAYEAGYFLEDRFKNYRNSQGAIPLYWMACYDSVLVYDHKYQKTFLASEEKNIDELKKEKMIWESALSDHQTTRTRLDSVEIRQPDKEKYFKKIAQIKQYLEKGDVYQINLAERFEATSPESPASLYHRLRSVSPVPYGAFLNCGSHQILSASPECFLQIKGQEVLTCPIKGTRKQSSNPEENLKICGELKSSEKDRAELLMIVDLERHDLGKVCETGSIHVDPLFSVESFAQVHHLVATVRGKLKKNLNAADALKALFPGGSVTGAPKIRAMEIIRELEECPRSVYTGAMGTIGLNGTAQFNMPIRTLTRRGQNVTFHAGGGIVIDSDPEAEYEEMMAKTEGMIKSL